MCRLCIGKEQSSLASCVAEVDGPTVFDALLVDPRGKSLDPDRFAAGSEAAIDLLSMSAAAMDDLGLVSRSFASLDSLPVTCQ